MKEQSAERFGDDGSHGGVIKDGRERDGGGEKMEETLIENHFHEFGINVALSVELCNRATPMK